MASQTVDFQSMFSSRSICDERAMQHDLLRLATFEHWPDDVKQRPTSLASNGFYYTGHADQVKCFSCGGELKMSRIDDITKEHKRNFPRCQFVRAMFASKKRVDSCHRSDAGSLNVIGEYLKELKSLSQSAGSPKPNETKSPSRPAESAGSPKPNEMKSPSRPAESAGSPKPNEMKSLNRTAESAISQKPNIPGVKLELMNDEKQRLLTFQDRWPSGSSVSPADLAKAGFYYSGSGDKVICAFCAGNLAVWMPGDKPLEQHQKFFPHCPFLAGATMHKMPAQIEDSKNQVSSSQPSEYPVKFPKFRTESSRKESFKNWQRPSVISPEVLAEAGFFYLGYSDNVKCFCCGGGLRNWNSSDDPWEQHAKWYSDCEYLKQCKGNDFIQQVLSSCAQAINFVRTISVGAGSVMRNPTEPRNLARMNDEGFTQQSERKASESGINASAGGLPSLEMLTKAFYTDKIMKRISGGSTSSSEGNSSGLSRRQKKNQRKKQKQKEESKEKPPCSKNKQLQNGDREENNDVDPMQLASSNLMGEQIRCQICMDKERNIAFSPCGHAVCCTDCAAGLRICPICRNVIKNKFRIYLT